MSRWGGFRKGRRRYTNNWDEVKSPSAIREETVADTPQQFSYAEAQGIWNLRSTMQFPKSNQIAPISLTFVASATGAISTTIPLDIQDGDIAIFYASAHGTAVNTEVIPSGFTLVQEDLDSADSVMMSGYKLLVAADAGVTLTGYNESREYCAVIVFRPNWTVASISSFSVNGQATISTPSSQTIDVSLAPSNLAILSLAFMSCTTTLVPTTPGMTALGVDTASDAFYKIFDSTAVAESITVSMPDEGDNVIQSWGIAIN
jgi:hypothetical protein